MLSNVHIRVASRLLVIGGVIAVLAGVDTARGQAGEAEAPAWDWYSVSGSAGFVGELYSADGIRNRRDPAVARVFANSSFSVLGFRSGFNITYATNQSGLRQSLNRLAFRASRNGFTLSAGDVSPSFSEYSLSGTTLRGGLVEFENGRWTAGLTAGRSRRAVDFSTQPGFRDPSFLQMLYGGRVGYESASGNGLHLMAVYARDVAGSLDDPGEALPAQSLSFMPQVRLSLLRGRIRFEGQVAGSVYTPDVRAPVAEGKDLPWIVAQLLSPRAGTHVNYAGDAGLMVRTGAFGLQAAYSRVQPGFTSLGVARLRSDIETLNLRPQIWLFDRRLNIGAGFGLSHNNLLGQLTSTRSQMNAGLTVQARPTEWLVLSGNYARLGSSIAFLEGAAGVPLPSVEQLSQTFQLSSAFNVRSASLGHSLLFSGAYQSSDAEGGAVAAEQGTTNATGTMVYVLQFGDGISVSLNSSMVRSSAPFGEISALNLNLGTGYGFFGGALNTTLSGGWAQTTTTMTGPAGQSQIHSGQWVGDLGASYRLGESDSFRLQLRGLMNAQGAGGEHFREVQASLRYQHQF